jgi:phosphatidylglycerophosphatase C
MTERQGPAEGPIVAFDFDGTLTCRDSFMAFLGWRSGPARFAAGLLALAPAGAAYLAHRDRGRIKAAAVRRFLRGIEREALVRACSDFAQSPLGRRLVRPDAEHCWRDWRGRGARMVIVTASPEEVVAPFAERLGADVLIGTRLRYGPDGRVAGAFEGVNCRGPEKVRRLRERFGPEVRLAAAYGDTGGDREMLQLADVKGYRVFHQRA